MSFCSLVRGHPISPMWAILSPSASRIWIRFGPRSAPCSGSCQVSIFVMENGFFVPLCFKVTASVYPWSPCSWLQSTMSAVRESGASPGTVFGPYGSKTMEKPSFSMVKQEWPFQVIEIEFIIMSSSRAVRNDWADDYILSWNARRFNGRKARSHLCQSGKFMWSVLEKSGAAAV